MTRAPDGKGVSRRSSKKREQRGLTKGEGWWRGVDEGVWGGEARRLARGS